MNGNTDVSAVQTGLTQAGQSPGGVREAAGSDAFAMLLLQLLGGGDGTDQDPMLSILPMAGEEEPQKKGTELASQMLAEFLLDNHPGMQDLSPAGQEWIQQALAGGNQMPAAAALFGRELPGVKLPDGTPNADGGAFAVPQAQPETAAEAQRLPVAEASGTAPQQTGGESAFGGELQFMSSINEAKKQLRQQGGSEAGERFPAEALDVEQLQRAADSGRYDPTSAVNKVERSPSFDGADVVRQVKQGIVSNLTGGKDEFVVKLKPEGLGEITVKLVETGGKIALTIAASDAQVAKALNSGLVELRETLRPYQADVREVVQQQDPYASMEHGGFGQSFGSQQHFQNQQPQQDHWSPWDAGDFPQDVTKPLLWNTLDGELDTYI